MTVKVTGLRETIKSLEKAGTEVSDLKAAFAPISNEATRLGKAAAPVRSGALSNSIKPFKNKDRAGFRAGSRRVPYAKWSTYANASPNKGWAHSVDPKLERFAVDTLTEALTKLTNNL